MSSETNEIVFQATDPRGIEVICTAERWYGHILSSRPFMEGWENHIIEAICNPHFGIYKDAQYSNRCIYYRRQQKPRYIKVVVVETESGPYKVVTAFPTDSMKSGEELIWTQSNV